MIFNNSRSDRWLLFALAGALSTLLLVAPATVVSAQEASDDEESADIKAMAAEEGAEDLADTDAILAEDLDSTIPTALRVQLEAPLNKKVAELRDIENDKGIHNVRASYMKRFVKVDDDAYQVVLHKRIAGDLELTVERYLITLERESSSSDSWTIADEKLERTFDGFLFRQISGDETFHAFDSFSADAEGMKISGGKGTMWVDYWQGKPRYMLLMADNLAYDYNPPVELNYHQINKLLKRKDKYKNDLVFEPARMFIHCEGDMCQKFLDNSFEGLRETDKGSIDPKLQDKYNDAMKAEKNNRKDNPMAGYVSNIYPDRKWYTVALKRASSSEHWAWLNFDSYEPEEVSYGVSRMGDFDTYGPIFTYNSEETRASGVSPYDLERRDDSNALAFDLVSVKGKVDLGIEDADTMNCDLTYRLKIKKPTDFLVMSIAQLRGNRGDTKRASMNVYFIEDGEGNELSYLRRGSSWGYVSLGETRQEGEEVQIRVKFTNSNAIYKINPSYSYVDRGGWMPFVRFGDMIDGFDLTIRAPKRYEVLGVGHPVSDKIEGEARVVRFESDSAVSFPTIIVGDYIDAKPGFKATKFDGTEIPVRVYVDKTSTMSYGNWQSREEAIGEVNSGIEEIRPNSLKPIAEQAANSLNLYREVYGVDYPFKKLDLVNDPVGSYFYGQAPASIVYLGTGVFRATGEMAHGGGSSISEFKESVVAHEVAHQWWGSLVAMGNQRNYWFVESLAEYSSALFIESLYGRKSPQAGRKAYLDKVDEWRRVVLEAASYASVQDVDTMWSGGDFPGQARQAAIYNQGPYAFHILRETFGDEKFFAFLKALAQEYQGNEIVTRDIQNVAETSFGGTMEWFFDQWIRNPGIPEYSFNYTTRMAEDKTYIVEGNIKQRVVLGPDKQVLEGAFYRGIITVTVTGVDKQDYPVRILVENETTPFQFKVPVKPRDIVLNKSGEMLAHDIFVNEDFY